MEEVRVEDHVLVIIPTSTSLLDGVPMFPNKFPKVLENFSVDKREYKADMKQLNEEAWENSFSIISYVSSKTLSLAVLFLIAVYLAIMRRFNRILIIIVILFSSVGFCYVYFIREPRFKSDLQKARSRMNDGVARLNEKYQPLGVVWQFRTRLQEEPLWLGGNHDVDEIVLLSQAPAGGQAEGDPHGVLLNPDVPAREQRQDASRVNVDRPVPNNAVARQSFDRLIAGARVVDMPSNSLIAPEVEVVCSTCAVALPPMSRFCNNCGSQVRRCEVCEKVVAQNGGPKCTLCADRDGSGEVPS